MAKSAEKKLYFKLGPNATAFHDPKSGLNIAGKEVAEVSQAKAMGSRLVVNAKANGHIIEVEESEFKKSDLKAPVQGAAAEMTDAEKVADKTASTQDLSDDEDDDTDEDDEDGDDYEAELKGMDKASLQKEYKKVVGEQPAANLTKDELIKEIMDNKD